MKTGQLHVASTFTSTPIEPSLGGALVQAGIASGLGFTQYAQVSHYMLSPDSAHIAGTLVLVRAEDWLRDLLKSSPILPSRQQLRDHLRSRTEEFVSQITTLSQRGKPVWFLACPSTGWVSNVHKVDALCQTYTNLLFARVENNNQVTALRWPAFLFQAEFEDRGADRLGQIPFAQECFDKLGRFLGHQLTRTWSRTSQCTPVSRDIGSAELAAFLASLNVHILLAPATDENRHHFDRILRAAASFSLAGEQRELSDNDLNAFFASGTCLLVNVSDRLSNYGATGVVAFTSKNDSLVVTSMALSCAVLGKQVEWALIHALARIADDRKLDKLVFEYRPSERNQPMLAFLKSAASPESENRYILPVADVNARLRAAAVNPDAFTVAFESGPAQVTLP